MEQLQAVLQRRKHGDRIARLNYLPGVDAAVLVPFARLFARVVYVGPHGALFADQPHVTTCTSPEHVQLDPPPVAILLDEPQFMDVGKLHALSEGVRKRQLARDQAADTKYTREVEVRKEQFALAYSAEEPKLLALLLEEARVANSEREKEDRAPSWTLVSVNTSYEASAASGAKVQYRRDDEDGEVHLVCHSAQGQRFIVFYRPAKEARWRTHDEEHTGALDGSLADTMAAIQRLPMPLPDRPGLHLALRRRLSDDKEEEEEELVGESYVY